MMTTKKEPANYLDKIKEYTEKKGQFIDTVQDAINIQTLQQEEKKHRLGTFNSLLLMATYANSASLEKGFLSSLPLSSDQTIIDICNQLREINGFCTQTFSDEHEGYQNIYNTITYLNSQIKQSIRDKLSDELTSMIFAKTGTVIQQASSPKM